MNDFGLTRHRLSPGKSLGLLILLLLTGLFFTALAQMAIAFSGISQRSLVLTSSALQGILAFILPAFGVAMYAGTKEGMREMGLLSKPGATPFISAFAIYILAIPAMNQLIAWNEGMHLPEALNAIETQLRTWEENAAELTRAILSGTSAGSLAAGILIIGCLTGFAEESFFRGGLQRILIGMKLNAHLAIWITAFVFSAVHFQFFGFLPRMLLGAYFGYLYYWTGSLWVAAFAHALNNSIAVLTAWMDANGYLSFNPDTLGVTEGFPVSALVSLAVVAFALTFHRKLFPTALSYK